MTFVYQERVRSHAWDSVVQALFNDTGMWSLKKKGFLLSSELVAQRDPYKKFTRLLFTLGKQTWKNTTRNISTKPH